MKVAIVSTYDLEGGAARAALRLHQALRGAGVDSTMVVQQRSGTDPSVAGLPGSVPRLWGRLRWRLDQAPAALAGSRRGEFSVNALGGGSIASQIEACAPDIVHLHWVNAGYVSLGEVLALRRPLVWTAHDMWPFTGGCHYDRGCGRYAERCRPCPQQPRWPALPLALWRQRVKTDVAAARDIVYVAPSRWMADVGLRSAVGHARAVHVIPNAIDLDRFRPIDRKAARALFGLWPDRVVLLFGGLASNTDPRKGYAQLDAALRLLAATPWAARLGLCVFGSAVRGDETLHGIPVRHVGHLHDEESLIALYSAADVFVAPSLQDNLPNTVLEAAACALPTVAFEIGGMSDLIAHGVSGWLAKAGDAASLAQGLTHAASDAGWRAAASRAARAHAEAHFSNDRVAAAHLALYETTLRTRAAAP